jgi:hypothetical protein
MKIDYRFVPAKIKKYQFFSYIWLVFISIIIQFLTSTLIFAIPYLIFVPVVFLECSTFVTKAKSRQ